MTGLAINVNGAEWSSECIIGTMFPQPEVASIATYGNLNFKALLGAAPTVIGAPPQSDYYFTGKSDNYGYNLNVADAISKTMMVLIRAKSTTRFLGMGNYLNGTSIPQGDTFIFEPAIPQIRAVVGRSVGVATATMSKAMALDKFYLAFMDVSDSALQLHIMENGDLVSSTQSVVTNRAIPSANNSTLAGKSINTLTDFLGQCDIAMTGYWKGVNLTTAEKQAMCDYVVALFGTKLPLA